MKIYVVEHVKPDMQVFGTYDEAFAFAKAKADKRRPKADIAFEPLGAEYAKLIYCPIPWTENHINIYERELKERD